MTEENVPQEVDVAVVGGGVGGLAAALGLSRAGVDVHVFEQAEQLAELGGALTVDQVTQAILDDWGIGDTFRDISVALDGMVAHTEEGVVLSHVQLPDLGAMGANIPGRDGIRQLRGARRADLQFIVRDALPPDRLHLAKKLVSVTEHDSFVEASFSDGTSVRAKVLLGADGIRSAVRRLFTEAESVRSNMVVCSTIVPIEAMPSDFTNDRMRFWNGWHEDGTGVNTVMCPVLGGTHLEVGTVLVGHADFTDLKLGTSNIEVDSLIARYRDTADPIIVAALTQTTLPVYQWPIYDQPPTTEWVTRRVALVGDAAHAIRPTLGQGACQSIQDADQVARSLATVTDFSDGEQVAAALKEYEDLRLPTAVEVQRLSRELEIASSTWDKDEALSAS